MRELELPETADAEIDVGEAGPPFVSGPEQGLGVGSARRRGGRKVGATVRLTTRCR